MDLSVGQNSAQDQRETWLQARKESSRRLDKGIVWGRHSSCKMSLTVREVRQNIGLSFIKFYSPNHRV